MIGNGVDGTTGRYLPEQWSDAAAGASEVKMSPALKRHYQVLQEELEDGFDPDRLYAHNVDPKRLDSARWAVIFGPCTGRNQEIRKALAPLLEQRASQMGSPCREIPYDGQSKFQFLADIKAAPGIADPKSLPYYLLLVGGPEEISFSFQTEMDLEYGVGRLCFEEPGQYETYVQSVLAAESGISRNKGVTIFSVNNDGPTQTLQEGLLAPLASFSEAERPDWPVRRIAGDAATLESLGRVAGGEEATSLLITGSHGLAFPPGHSRQLQEQGALFLGVARRQDNPAAAVSSGSCFSGTETLGNRDLRGMIVCLFACYSGGTPDIESYRERSLSRPRTIAPRPFVSCLSQQLLSNLGGGALAVLGHLDRMWSTSFQWSDPRQIEAYRSLLQQLQDGYPVGSATEFLGQLHASFGAHYASLSESRANLCDNFDQDDYYRAWRAYSDARNFILLGDPAACLVHSG